MTYEAPRWRRQPPPRDIGMFYVPAERRMLRNARGVELEVFVFVEALTEPEFQRLAADCRGSVGDSDK